MSRNNWFEFKRFRIEQRQTAMKVGTDGVLLGAWTSVENSTRILDIGTGTGLLALMLAQRCEANIDAIDISEAAFLEAGLNFSRSIWKDRLKVYHNDIDSFSENKTKLYDVIVSNPPYFAKSLKTSDKEYAVARHDVNLTHDQLIKLSAKLLNNKGSLSLILPSENMNSFRESARLNGFYMKRRSDVITKAGKRPIRVLLEFSLFPCYPGIDQIIIREENGEFSKNYKALTSSYYLKF